MSPSRTSDCCCSNSTKVRKRERLMRPTGRSRARMRAGAIGDKGSTAIATLGASRGEATEKAIFYQRKKVVVTGRCMMSQMLKRRSSEVYD
jgi:hypothetical protein